MTPLHERVEWGARPARSVSHAVTPREIVCHYDGPSPWRGADTSSPAAFRDSTDHNRCASIVRADQAYHMDTHGWVDGAYTSRVCPHGHRYEQRGPGVRTAATGEANGFTYAVCAIIGDDDPITDEMKAGFLDEQYRLGVPLASVHNDYMQTRCAGPWFDQWKIDGFGGVGAVVVDAAAPVLPPLLHRARRRTMLTIQDPDTDRIHHFVIGWNGRVLHAQADTWEAITALRPEHYDDLGGNVVSIAGSFAQQLGSEGLTQRTIVLWGQSPTGGMFANAFDGIRWGGWAQIPGAQLLAA